MYHLTVKCSIIYSAVQFTREQSQNLSTFCSRHSSDIFLISAQVRVAVRLTKMFY